MELIVTDLTRFARKDILCMAGVTFDGTRCVRPMTQQRPGYLSFDVCKNHSILPGTVLIGDFVPFPNATAPHVEDCSFTSLRAPRMATPREFYDVLSNSSFSNISTGFGMPIHNKLVPTPPQKSIITLRVRPADFRVVPDKYDNTKIKAHVIDDSGREFSFLSITDLGLSDFIGNPSTRRLSVEEFNRFIREQDELFLRIGLSRQHQSDDGRSGYWLQVNGVYSFPNYQQIIRSY